MSTTERRRCLTAAVAVIAVAAAVALAPESSAKGGPGKSPFAGTYGWVTGSYYGNTWAVTISDKGQIAGSLVAGYGYSKGSLGGRVNGDGSYSFTMSLTAPIFDDGERGPSGGPKSYTERTEFAGTLAPGADGNVVGTPTTGGSFVWFVQ